MKRKIPPHLLAVLVLGAVSQIAQVLFLRELLMVFHGSELSIGLILAAWLLWVGLGSYGGAYLVNRFHRPLTLLALSAAGVAVSLPATLLLMRGLRGFFDLLPGASLSLPEMIVSCFLLVAPTCLLLGAQFVLLSRVWRESDQVEDTSAAGKTYVGEAAGNMLGGLVFTFVMVQYLNSFQSALLAIVLMPAAVLLIVWRKGRARGLSPAAGMRGIRRQAGWQPELLAGGLVLGVIVTAVSLAFPLLKALDDWAYQLQWRQFMPQHQLVETRQSRHGTIAVVQREQQYSFFQSGHLVFSTAGPEMESVGFEEQEAVTSAHFAMVQHQQPRRVLLIGGGMRGVLSEIIKHPVEQVDYVELDEVLTAAARAFISPETQRALADERVELIHSDGRLFVKSAGHKYDLIIVDAPDPATAVLNRYYTQEFFRQAQALLEADGVLVVGVSSTPDLRGTAIANRNTTLYHTLKSVFDHVLAAGDRFLFYFATNAPEQVSEEAALLQERYLQRQIEAEGFSAQHYEILLQESTLQRVNWILRNHGRSQTAHLQGPAGVPLQPGSIAEQERAEEQIPPVQQTFINSDFRPIGYFYTLMYLDDLTRAGQTETLRALLQVQFWWVLPFFGLPLLTVFGLRAARRRGSKRSDTYLAVLFSVFTTGFSTMALQIALLFSFQSIYGFVYEIVGLIVATFMCGLAVGAWFSHRYVINKANFNTLALVQLLIGLAASLIAVSLPAAAGVQSAGAVFGLFSALTFSAGLINGVDFPLAAACFMALKGQAEQSAGSVYGVELLGACVGAALASVVIAPILGIIACCLIAALANYTAFGALMISRRT
ncbi:MAG: fused MFS/spermidine synthase [Anaerolineales bacterium]